MKRTTLLGALCATFLMVLVGDGVRSAEAASFPVKGNCSIQTCIEFGPVPAGGGVIPIMVWGTGKRGFFDQSIGLQRTAADSSTWSSWGGVRPVADPLAQSDIGPDVMFVVTPQIQRNKARMSYAIVGALDRAFQYRVAWYPGKYTRPNNQPWRFVAGSGPTFRADDVFDLPPPAGTLRQWIRRLGCNGCDLQRWDGTAWVPTTQTSLVKGDLFAFQRNDGRWLRAMIPGRA